MGKAVEGGGGGGKLIDRGRRGQFVAVAEGRRGLMCSSCTDGSTGGEGRGGRREEICVAHAASLSLAAPRGRRRYADANK